MAASSAHGQTTPPAAAQTASAAPEPIYWRQNLFLIPYQWSSTIDPSSAQAVWLYVSKDRGTNWQKISEAKPQVRAFNYHAEADGEYWFAIRTVDTHGQSWPVGSMQAELKVIVDTTIPRFGNVTGVVREGGNLEIQWQVADENIDPNSCKVEVQTDPAAAWQAVTSGRSHACKQRCEPREGVVPVADRLPDCSDPRCDFRPSWQSGHVSNQRQRKFDGCEHSPMRPRREPSGPHSLAVVAILLQHRHHISCANVVPPMSAVASSPLSPSAGWVSGTASAAATSNADQPLRRTALAGKQRFSVDGEVSSAVAVQEERSSLSAIRRSHRSLLALHQKRKRTKLNSRFVAFGSSPSNAAYGRRLRQPQLNRGSSR